MSLAFSGTWPWLALLVGLWALLVDGPALYRASLYDDARVVRRIGWIFMVAGVVSWVLIRMR